PRARTPPTSPPRASGSAAARAPTPSSSAPIVASQLPLEGPPEPLHRRLVVEGEHDGRGGGGPGGVLAPGRTHGLGRRLHGPPAAPGAQGGQAHAGQPLGGGQAQRG